MPLCSSQKGLGLKTRCQSNLSAKNRRILQRGFGCFGSVYCWNAFKTKGWCPKCNSTFLLWLPPFLYSHQRIHDAPSSSQLVHWFQNPLNCTLNLGGSFFHLPAPKVFYCMHSCDCCSIWHPECFLWDFSKKKAAHTIVSSQSIKALVSRRRFWRDHIMIWSWGTEQAQQCHLKSQSQGQMWCHPTSFVETLTNAFSSFCSSSSYCAGTDWFRKPWQKRAGKVALLNPVYLTVSITTWHSYL